MSNAKRQHALVCRGVQWLILDAAACPEPLWFARGAGLDTLSLFRQQDEELATAAPGSLQLTENPGQSMCVCGKIRWATPAFGFRAPLAINIWRMPCGRGCMPACPEEKQRGFAGTTREYLVPTWKIRRLLAAMSSWLLLIR